MTTRRPLAILLFGLLGCGGAESHDEAHSALLPVAADEVAPLTSMPSFVDFAPPSAKPAAQPGAKPGTRPGAKPGQPAAPPADIKLDPETEKAVASAVGLYKGFMDITAKYPADCKGLTKDLTALATRSSNVMKAIKALEGKLSQPQMRAAQQKMQAGLPGNFFQTLIETAKRCETEPGFQDAMNLLQGKSTPK